MGVDKAFESSSSNCCGWKAGSERKADVNVPQSLADEKRPAATREIAAGRNYNLNSNRRKEMTQMR